MGKHQASLTFIKFITIKTSYMLRHKDGEIYDNIQFNANILLAIDAPLGRYMHYVNPLKPFLWSCENGRPHQP